MTEFITKNNKRFIKLSEYAQINGLTYDGALKRMHRGYLPTKKIYGLYHVDMKELDRMNS